MASEEIGGYVLLTGYGLMLLWTIKVFGFRKVMAVVLGIVFLGVGIAFRTLRGISSRRY